MNMLYFCQLLCVYILKILQEDSKKTTPIKYSNGVIWTITCFVWKISCSEFITSCIFNTANFPSPSSVKKRKKCNIFLFFLNFHSGFLVCLHHTTAPQWLMSQLHFTTDTLDCSTVLCCWCFQNNVILLFSES